MEKTLKSQIPIKILTTANSNGLNKSSVVLIKANQIDTEKLVGLAEKANAKIHALVNYSGASDVLNLLQNLSNQGFVEGSYVFINIEDVGNINEIQSIYSNLRQGGYYVGLVNTVKGFASLDEDDVKNISFYKMIDQDGDNSITVGDTDGYINGLNIDLTGKLNKQPITRKERNTYTNVDVNTDSKGWVGIGQDTVLGGGKGFGYSTMGNDFNTVISPKGIIFRRPDAERMWELLKPKQQAEVSELLDHTVADEIKNQLPGLEKARQQADEAVKFAESAVAASKANSDAIVAQSEAISEAKSAMDSATAEIQQTAANAASDAAKIRADVAQVQSEVDTAKAANSASVEALKSDVSAAKQDLADVHDSLTKAQSAIEQNQKLINDSVTKITSDVSATKQDLANVHDSLTKAQAAAEQNQKAINDSIAQINANVDATNQDLAGVRKDLTKAQSDITANQKVVNDNVAQINSNIEQDRKNIASAQQANANTAKQLDTYSKQAQEQERTIKAVQDKQDGFSIALADVQGNVTQVSDKVDGLSASLKDAQDNVASVKAQADQLSATLTDHAKSIATLTASAKELSSTLEDADGRLSKVEQTAQTNSSTLSDVQGDLSQVKQNATKLVSTLKDAQGNISTLQQKADSVSTQLASAQGDIATLQTGVDSVKATLTDHDKSIHTLQADSKSLKDSMANAQGDISMLSKTATDVTSELEDHTGRLSKVEQTASKQETTLSDLQDNLTQVKQQADGLVTTLKDAQGNITQVQQKADGTLEQLKNAQGDIASLQTDVTGIKATLTSHEGDIHTLQADSKTLKDDMADTKGNISSLQKTSTSLVSEFRDHDGRLSKVEQTVTEHTSELADTKGNIDKVTQKANTLQLLLSDAQKDIQNIQLDAKGLHDTLTGQSNQLASLNVTLNNLDSKYSGITGDLQSKQTALSTEQQQTKDMLLRKADKSEVDNVKGTVNQVSAEQKTMADQINQKVSSVEYQTLKDKVNGMKIGGRNLAVSTSHEWQNKSGFNGGTNVLVNVADYIDLSDVKVGDTLQVGITIKKTSGDDSGNASWFVQGQKNGDGWGWIRLGSTFYNKNYTNDQSYKVASFVTVTDSIKKGQKLKPVQIRFDNVPAGTIFSWKDFYVKIGATPTDWTPAPEDTITAIQKNTTAIDENSKLISLMAKQTEVDNVKNTAQQISSRLDILAGEVKSKVDETRVNSIVDGRGYATTSTVQSLVDQKAGTINESITKLDGKLTHQIQSVTASIDGLQSRVTNYQNDTSSKYTQLSDLMQSKVNQGDLNSVRTQLAGAINERVQKGELLSQINLTAGNTLIQSNKLYLDASSVVITGTAFIPSAAIAEIDADKLTFYGNGTKATIGAGIAEYDQDKVKSTINMQYSGGFEIHSSNELGSILTMHDNTVRLAVKSQVYGSGSGQPLNQQYSGVWFGSNYTLMNTVDKEGKTTGWAIGSNKSGANNDYRAYLYDNSTSVQPNYGVGIGTTRFDVYAGNSQLFLGPDKGELRGSEHATLHGGTQTYVEGGNEQIYIHDGEVNIGNPNNIGSATGVHLQVFGWATFNGYVEAMGFNTKSTLSSKTRITPLDTADALDKITSTDLTTFQYKTEVAEGFTKRHAGPIIDDVNDVAQYRTPNAFISENRQGRSDADIIGYLMGAVQELTKQLNKLKKEVQING